MYIDILFIYIYPHMFAGEITARSFCSETPMPGHGEESTRKKAECNIQ